MDAMAYLEQQKARIDRLIAQYWPRALDERAMERLVGPVRYQHDLEAVNRGMADPIWDFLDRGGKRWRPALFLLVAEALGGDMDAVKDACIIPELAHEGSIVVDDIEDLGEMRRGKPALHKLFGEDIAINAGNFLYFLPLVALPRLRVERDLLLQAYGVYAEEMVNIHFGQGTDIFWHKGKRDQITEAQYLQMCAFKTGCLARMAGRLAAALSGADPLTERAVGRFCESLGIAFQIQDDILSASGGEFQAKKGFGDDITEGKRSLLVIHTLGKADPADRRRLLEILDQHTREPRLIEEALALLEKHGAAGYARELAQRLVQEAWQELSPLLKDSEAKDTLASFAQFAVERKL
ncbi:MAG: polyprenyl synthetase family protein [Candidatus Aenigmarchaeota archaeon]|nr:polyprenyl synthetase family protein [Candidatus Aenigmarchaeota archaeon]